MKIFKPHSSGCALRCKIDKKEKDICCKSARQCCFYCGENCPIKEVYKYYIKFTFFKIEFLSFLRKRLKKKRKGKNNLVLVEE